MSTIKFRWTVDELANVMTIFDTQRVWRAAAVTGPWVELTSVGTRVALVAGQTAYYFDDLSGVVGMYYAVSYYHSVSLAESDKSVPVRVDSLGYLAVEDIRNEGFAATAVTDAQVARGIALASATIDRVTRRWFEPRARTFRLDGNRGQELFLEVPVIALNSVTFWDEDVDLTDLLVYNRHLTQGLLNPDDRDNPRLAWTDEVLTERLRRDYQGLARWDRAHGNVVVDGVFGYTELEPLDTPGETTPGSQVPLSYGVTPPMIKRACMLLTVRYMYPYGGGLGEEFRARARVVSESTADQSYSLTGAPSTDAAYGVTGDVEVDNILMAFMAPTGVGVI